MKPIEKNIIVIDEQGNEYEATYPKRAKGLVKNGRARFIDENTICLACPPDIESEDKNMSENTSMNTVTAPETTTAPDKFSVAYCLEQLEKIQAQTEYLNQAIEETSKIPSGDTGDCGSPGDLTGAEKARAMSEMVKCRETTNQKLVAFYEKMYDDLMQKVPAKDRAMEIIENAVAQGDCSASEVSELTSTLIGLMKL